MTTTRAATMTKRIAKNQVRIRDVVRVRWAWKREEGPSGRAKSVGRIYTFGCVSRLTEDTIFVSRDHIIGEGRCRDTAGIPRSLIEGVDLLYRGEEDPEE